MERLTFQFSFQDLKLDVPQVERTMGYKSGESDEVLAELIGAALDEAEGDGGGPGDHKARFGGPDRSGGH